MISLQATASLFLKSASPEYGVPEIVNTDQGCQYTSEDWIRCLKEHHIRISMDDKGSSLSITVIIDHIIVCLSCYHAEEMQLGWMKLFDA